MLFYIDRTYNGKKKENMRNDWINMKRDEGGWIHEQMLELAKKFIIWKQKEDEMFNRYLKYITETMTSEEKHNEEYKWNINIKE